MAARLQQIEAEQAALIAGSNLFEGRWYTRSFRDVSASGLDPALHYLRHGTAMGRNPGRRFDALAYLTENPDVAASGTNPLVHYLQTGASEGRAFRRVPPPPLQAGRKEIALWRDRLHGQGLTRGPLEALDALARTHPEPAVQALALLEQALWFGRSREPAQARAVLDLVARFHVLPDWPGKLGVRRSFAVLEQHALAVTEQWDAACHAFDIAAQAGLCSPNLLFVSLAAQRAVGGDGAALARINEALAWDRIAPLRLLDGSGPAYDRLALAAPLDPVADGPLVSVLIAAHDAGPRLDTALRSLTEQTWQNLEILVIDDASSDDTAERAEAWAARDARVRVFHLPQNRGAYVARNYGLMLAQGAFVTLHDSDDWTHPLRIETQMRALLAEPALMACTSQQVRMQDDLSCLRFTGPAKLVFGNKASLLFRKEPVIAALGCWDAVRFAADSEFIRRLKQVFGDDALVDLETGPLTFQRESSTSVLADPVKGMSGFYFGVRREYTEAQAWLHKSGASLNYGPGPAPRPFPVPGMMLPDVPMTVPAANLVLAGDFRDPDSAASQHALAAMKAALADGTGPVVLVMLPDPQAEGPWELCPPLRKAVAMRDARIAVYGETLTCAQIEVLSPAALESDPPRYLPAISAARMSCPLHPGNAVPVWPAVSPE